MQRQETKASQVSSVPDEEGVRILAMARLLVLDVDGVLTDGRVVYGDYGEQQSFSAHDGAALRWLMKEGVKLAWITGRGCAATERRAHELGIDELIQVQGPKGESMEEIQARWDIGEAETVAMGDDLADLALRRRSRFFAAPPDARAEIRRVADLVTSATGGHGAVRELVEHILRAKGRWQAILDAAER